MATDVTGTYLGRAHVGTHWWSGVGDVAELDGVTFEADVENSSGAVLRSLTGAASPAGSLVNTAARTFLYVNADIITDYGGVPAAGGITIALYARNSYGRSPATRFTI